MFVIRPWCYSLQIESDLLTNPESDLDELLVQFDSTLRNTLNKHAPLMYRNIIISPTNPWYSREIAEAKRKRKQLERRWRKTKSEIDRDLFKQQRLIVSQMIANAKHSHYHQKIHDCNKDQKQFF